MACGGQSNVLESRPGVLERATSFRSRAGKLYVWFPLWVNLEIFLHVLVLEEEVLISEEALGKLGSRHNLSNCDFASLWARLSKDGVEG